MIPIATALVLAVPQIVAVQAFNGDSSVSQKFIRCLEQQALPRWQSLKRQGSLAANRVYVKVGEQNTQPGVDWSVLVVSGVHTDQAALSVGNIPLRCARLSQIELVRSALMRPTPASYHPAPPDRQKSDDLKFVVEFISVKDEPAALNEYRDIMQESIGPAIAKLVHENQFYSMIAMETSLVIRPSPTPSPSAFRWNQLHIRGYYPAIGVTPAAMTKYMAQANPRLGDFRQVFGHLDAIRTKPRDDIADEVGSLSL